MFTERMQFKNDQIIQIVQRTILQSQHIYPNLGDPSQEHDTLTAKITHGVMPLLLPKVKTDVEQKSIE